MKYKIFENRLEDLKRRYGHHRWDMTVSANKIDGKSFLIIKNSKGEVIECIILTDEKHYTEEELRKELGL